MNSYKRYKLSDLTQSDNMKDTVRDGHHHNANKKVCPKCGSEYKTEVYKTGWEKGKIKRYCPVCRAIGMARWTRKYRRKSA